MNMEKKHKGFGFAGRLAAMMIDSRLTPLGIILSILLGVFAVHQLPREEEPQIRVPMIDVLVAMPGASAREVENRVTKPMEKLLWEIPAVEYLYSTSSPGGSLVTARFKVGTDIETALVRLNQKLQTNFDRIPPGVSQPLIKPKTIDDVPILSLTLHSNAYDHIELRRIAEQVEEALKPLPQMAEIQLIGGFRRMLRVVLDPAALAAHNLGPMEVAQAIRGANQRTTGGSLPFNGVETIIETGTFIRSAADAGAVVLRAGPSGVVYLRDVAAIHDTGEEPANYVFHGDRYGELSPAVTLSIAKRPGANAVKVVEAVLDKVESLRGAIIPDDVELSISRDYGHTAKEKSNELLYHMGIAVFGVALLILLFLGWRESLVVLLAIPSTLALTLLVFYLYGYTLNRITLFALIFSIGILVDDAIVVVENIVRHFRLPGSQKRPLRDVALEAVDEVGNPTILATWAVIAAILPMAFVGGLMGPYMRPIPIGATAAMLFSLIIAFTITPWAAKRMLKRRLKGAVASGDADHAPDDWSTRLYHKLMEPLLDSPFWRWSFLLGILALLAGAVSLFFFGAVQVKMLPFDNKSEIQVIVNTPEGVPLEDTLKAAQEMAAVLGEAPEVRDFQIYAGTAAPFNFNGLVRHYFLRSGPNVADIQVNLVGKDQRREQSHDIAKRLRPKLAAIAERHGASIAVAEVPPGPPVMQTLVAEVYGPDEEQRIAIAEAVKGLMRRQPGVVDIDTPTEEFQPRLIFTPDEVKAAFHGIREQDIGQMIQLSVAGWDVDLLHLEDELSPTPIRLEALDSLRQSPDTLTGLWLPSATGEMTPLTELVNIRATESERSLHRKNLKPVTYVTADVAGEVESPAYAMFPIQKRLRELDARQFGASGAELPIYHLSTPHEDLTPALKWDGEWHITLEVFRDLGLAFAVVLFLIAALMIGWFHSYVTPLVVMAAIPFSMIGILPAHWAMGAFFTATSMIGFMAGAGIVVRNSIILVDFIELRRSHGLSLRDAVVEAGAVRFRPMLLTALAVVVGASVILADPIFQGLAISLMFGEIASVLISRMAVPVLYFMVKR